MRGDEGVGRGNLRCHCTRLSYLSIRSDLRMVLVGRLSSFDNWADVFQVFGESVLYTSVSVFWISALGSG